MQELWSLMSICQAQEMKRHQTTKIIPECYVSKPQISEGMTSNAFKFEKMWLLMTLVINAIDSQGTNV